MKREIGGERGEREMREWEEGERREIGGEGGERNEGV